MYIGKIGNKSNAMRVERVVRFSSRRRRGNWASGQTPVALCDGGVDTYILAESKNNNHDFPKIMERKKTEKSSCQHHLAINSCCCWWGFPWWCQANLAAKYFPRENRQNISLFLLLLLLLHNTSQPQDTTRPLFSLFYENLPWFRAAAEKKIDSWHIFVFLFHNVRVRKVWSEFLFSLRDIQYKTFQ